MGSWPETGAALPLPFARKRAPTGRTACPSCLPPIYPITPDGPVNAQWWRRFEAGLARGYAVLQLRVRTESRPGLYSAVERAARLCRHASCDLMFNGPLQWVEELDLAGIHLSAASLMTLEQRPLGGDRRVAASCHSPVELQRAQAIGADWVCLSPVKSTPSHPGVAPLGLETFSAWARQSKIPVYGLGGLGTGDVPAIQAAGGQGVAGISAFWS